MYRHKHRFLSYLMWLLPLSFFTYQFLLRLWPSLMMQQIMQQFAIDATAFGLLASVYYYGYAGMQIPMALALDRFKPRDVISFSIIICGLATYLFSITENWYLALLTRFLIGGSSAVGFLGTSKVISQWFPKDHYARMVGFTFTIGLIGAIYGGKPVSILVENFGWHQVAITLALVALSIGLLTYLALRDPGVSKHKIQPKFKLPDLKNLLRSPNIWLLAVANLLMVGSLEGFADVWGVNYLMKAYGLNKGDAAELISFIFIGMIFGGPILILLAKNLGNYTVISCCGLGMSLAFCYLLWGIANYNWYGLATLFIGIGIMCCYQVLVFSAGCDFVSIQLLGVTVAFLNCVNMLGGSFFHSLVGIMMDNFWTGGTSDGIRVYDLESYNHALIVIPLCSILGAVMVALVGKRVRTAS